jgi:hypothetical protein
MNCFEQPWVQRAVYGYGGKNQKRKKKSRERKRNRGRERQGKMFFFFFLEGYNSEDSRQRTGKEEKKIK